MAIALSLGPLIHSLSNKFWYGILHNLSFAVKLLRTSPSAYFIKINHLPQTLPFYSMSINHPPLPPCYPHHFSAINFTCWPQWFVFGCHYELTTVLLSSKLNDISSVQFSSSVVSNSLWPHELQHARPPCSTNSRNPPKPMSIELVMPSNHLILGRPLLLPPPIPPSIEVFCNESTLHMRWPKYWSFSFSINPSNEHPGLISFRMDWLDLQSHSPKASILWHSAFFTVQLSHPYMTTGKTTSLTTRTFVGKVISLLLNMLSRLVITFLPRSKRLLISWLQSPSAVILEPKKIKSDTVSTVSPSISHEVMGLDAMILVFWMLSFKPTFSLSSFTFIKRLFSSSSLSEPYPKKPLAGKDVFFKMIINYFVLLIEYCC